MVKQFDKELWDEAVAFHGHECPGLAIGFKACQAASEKMLIGFSDDEDIVCVTENDACGVDAVQWIFSCTLGKGNLIYRGTGKQAFSFFNRTSGESLRVCLKPNQNDGMDRPTWQKFLLDSPVDNIFTFSSPRFELPERARLFKTLICASCGEGAPEHKIRLQEGETLCLDCFKDYSREW